jgi:putative acetyltransferase
MPDMSAQILQPGSAHQWDAARRLVREYAATLGVDLCFQNFERELENFDRDYAAPKGAFLLAAEGGGYVACVGLRQFADEVGEMKRLYVTPAARGTGLGRQLVERLIAVARELGYRNLVLDTLPSMKEAQGLYQSLGFKPTAAYRFNPVPGSTFLRLDL